MLSFHAISHCSFISLSICFLMKLMIVLFLMLIADLFHVMSLINWFTASFSMISLQLDTHCMQIWHQFCCRLIRFYHILLNNFKLTLLFAFSLCSIIWLSVYTQISLSSDASLLHITIASLIACNFAFVIIISLITLVALLHLTNLCVNIIMISISVLSSAIIFWVCDALMYITMFLVFYSVYLLFCMFHLLRIRFASLSDIQFSDLIISWIEIFWSSVLN